MFGMIWAVGIARALAAAYQAKFHRLATLVLLGAPVWLPVSASSGCPRQISR